MASYLDTLILMKFTVQMTIYSVEPNLKNILGEIFIIVRILPYLLQYI